MQVHPSDKLMSYETIKAKYPAAVTDVEKGIRRSRSKERNEPFGSFQWFTHMGETTDSPRGPAQRCMRVYAFKGKLFRSSRLYDMKKRVIEGLWSF